MRTVSEVYPSKWLRAVDLQGRPARVQIVAVDVQDFRQRDGSQEARIVISFARKHRRLVCNRTQAQALAEILGTEEFERWIDRDVILAPGRAPNGQQTIVITAPAPLEIGL